VQGHASTRVGCPEGDAEPPYTRLEALEHRGVAAGRRHGHQSIQTAATLRRLPWCLRAARRYDATNENDLMRPDNVKRAHDPTMLHELVRHSLDRLADELRRSRHETPDDLVGREKLWTAREKLRSDFEASVAAQRATTATNPPAARST
jgi:hypothetical protein